MFLPEKFTIERPPHPQWTVILVNPVSNVPGGAHRSPSALDNPDIGVR
jgi:hypothetical protein